jgi:hypothetical protein
VPKQLHKSFQDVQLRGFKLPNLLQVLKIGRSRFFALLKACRKDPANSSIAYKRRWATLSIDRVADAYRQVSFSNLQFKLKGVSPRDCVQLRIVPDFEKDLAEIRFWHEQNFLGAQKIKLGDLKLVHF